MIDQPHLALLRNARRFIQMGVLTGSFLILTMGMARAAPEQGSESAVQRLEQTARVDIRSILRPLTPEQFELYRSTREDHVLGHIFEAFSYDDYLKEYEALARERRSLESALRRWMTSGSYGGIIIRMLRDHPHPIVITRQVPAGFGGVLSRGTGILFLSDSLFSETKTVAERQAQEYNLAYYAGHELLHEVFPSETETQVHARSVDLVAPIANFNGLAYSRMRFLVKRSLRGDERAEGLLNFSLTEDAAEDARRGLLGFIDPAIAAVERYTGVPDNRLVFDDFYILSDEDLTARDTELKKSGQPYADVSDLGILVRSGAKRYWAFVGDDHFRVFADPVTHAYHRTEPLVNDPEVSTLQLVSQTVIQGMNTLDGLRDAVAFMMGREPQSRQQVEGLVEKVAARHGWNGTTPITYKLKKDIADHWTIEKLEAETEEGSIRSSNRSSTWRSVLKRFQNLVRIPWQKIKGTNHLLPRTLLSMIFTAAMYGGLDGWGSMQGIQGMSMTGGNPFQRENVLLTVPLWIAFFIYKLWQNRTIRERSDPPLPKLVAGYQRIRNRPAPSRWQIYWTMLTINPDNPSFTDMDILVRAAQNGNLQATKMLLSAFQKYEFKPWNGSLPTILVAIDVLLASRMLSVEWMDARLDGILKRYDIDSKRIRMSLLDDWLAHLILEAHRIKDADLMNWSFGRLYQRTALSAGQQKFDQDIESLLWEPGHSADQQVDLLHRLAALPAEATPFIYLFIRIHRNNSSLLAAMPYDSRLPLEIRVYTMGLLLQKDPNAPFPDTFRRELDAFNRSLESDRDGARASYIANSFLMHDRFQAFLLAVQWNSIFQNHVQMNRSRLQEMVNGIFEARVLNSLVGESNANSGFEFVIGGRELGEDMDGPRNGSWLRWVGLHELKHRYLDYEGYRARTLQRRTIHEYLSDLHAGGGTGWNGWREDNDPQLREIYVEPRKQHSDGKTWFNEEHEAARVQLLILGPILERLGPSAIVRYTAVVEAVFQESRRIHSRSPWFRRKYLPPHENFTRLVEESLWRFMGYPSMPAGTDGQKSMRSNQQYVEIVPRDKIEKILRTPSNPSSTGETSNSNPRQWKFFHPTRNVLSCRAA